MEHLISQAYAYHLQTRTSRRSRRRAMQRAIKYAKIARTVDVETRLFAAIFAEPLQAYDTFDSVRLRVSEGVTK